MRSRTQKRRDVLQSNDWVSLTNFTLPSSPYLWVDTTVPATARRFYRAVLVAPTNMVWISAGTFMMGSPTNEVDRNADGDEGPQTTVTITRGFWMGKYEVTQKDYQAVMGVNPSYFIGDPNRPVEQVSRNDAANYCGQLTQQERDAGRISASWVYRLPTEAEWEYASRAGTSTRFSYGEDPGYTNLANYAWYLVNGGGQPHIVGQKQANPWGLHDMYGNVWEWCQDWYGAYLGGSVTDPQGPFSGSRAVVRGAGWNNFGRECRSASRLHDNYPTDTRALIGFRIVLSPVQIP